MTSPRPRPTSFPPRCSADTHTSALARSSRRPCLLSNSNSSSVGSQRLPGARDQREARCRTATSRLQRSFPSQVRVVFVSPHHSMPSRPHRLKTPAPSGLAACRYREVRGCPGGLCSAGADGDCAAGGGQAPAGPGDPISSAWSGRGDATGGRCRGEWRPPQAAQDRGAHVLSLQDEEGAGGKCWL